MSKLKKGNRPRIRNGKKPLSKGQKYIASQTEPFNKLDASDFKALKSKNYANS